MQSETLENEIFDTESEDCRSCLEYINGYWPTITRSVPESEDTLIGLPSPFVTPNADMFCEQYYWDSYFISLGLVDSPHRGLVKDMTENLIYLMNRFGRIPNASRYYFLSRSQPPLLTSMIRLTIDCMRKEEVAEDDLKTWLQRAYSEAKREYFNVWRASKFPDEREVHRGLSRYYDLNIWHNAAEAESGWDMTPRFDDRCLDFIPIDLNCLLLTYERDFIVLSMLLESDESSEWEMRATERRSLINEILWDEENSIYCDFDFVNQMQSSFLSIASFFALWSEAATPERAQKMINKHLATFEHLHGLTTTEEWHPQPEEFGKQWAWPNGWAPLHWAAIAGLHQYGYREHAARISSKWLSLVTKIFCEEGVLFEKYNVVSGTRAVCDRYPDQVGFGWTNGVYVRLVEFLRTGALLPKL